MACNDCVAAGLAARDTEGDADDVPEENCLDKLSTNGARAMPISVIIAVIIAAGVTSKAGCRAFVPFGVIR